MRLPLDFKVDKKATAKVLNLLKPDTVKVSIVNGRKSLYRLDWHNATTNAKQFICNCYGHSNAIRVAQGIAENQVEFTCYGPKLDTDTGPYD